MSATFASRPPTDGHQRYVYRHNHKLRLNSGKIVSNPAVARKASPHTQLVRVDCRFFPHKKFPSSSLFPPLNRLLLGSIQLLLHLSANHLSREAFSLLLGLVFRFHQLRRPISLHQLSHQLFHLHALQVIMIFHFSFLVYADGVWGITIRQRPGSMGPNGSLIPRALAHGNCCCAIY